MSSAAPLPPEGRVVRFAPSTPSVSVTVVDPGPDETEFYVETLGGGFTCSAPLRPDATETADTPIIVPKPDTP